MSWIILYLKERTGDDHLNRVGVDVLEVSRIQRAIEKNGRFKDRIYTRREIDHIDKKNSHRTAGGLFSAKEAVSKLLGTGISGFSWKDIEVTSDERGKPRVTLHRQARRVAIEQGIEDIEISISHGDDTVVAVAVARVAEDHIEYDLEKLLPARSRETHKGDYGKVALVGGSRGMAGSIYLSSIASLRTGSGLVYTVVPDSISTVMEIKSVENIVIPVSDGGRGHLNKLDHMLVDKLCGVDAIGIGPGMSKNKDTVEFLRDLLGAVDKPYVIDADGINNLSSLKEEVRSLNRKIVITPHLAELSRFLEVPIGEIKKKREEYAEFAAKTYGLIVVLKGENTIVTDGINTYINKTGNPGMATAGSGDVLTGIIASLIGQGHDLFEASRIGVYIHGLAGDLARLQIGEYGMIASDIVSYIPKAIKRVECREELEHL